MFTLTQNRWKIDDVLGVWPLHGLCGAWGGIAAGIFGAKALGGLGGVSFSAQLLGPRFVGFNTGRWDYINSVSDAVAWDADFRNPNIDAITMTYGYMRVYEDRVRRAVNMNVVGRFEEAEKLARAAVEAQRGREPGGQRDEKRFEGAHGVFAHREEGPAALVLEHQAELPEELGLGGLAGSIAGDHLLELVKDKDLVHIAEGAPLQIL